MPVTYRAEDGIATITLDRPALNQLDAAMRQSLLAAVCSVAADDSIVAAVITGNNKAFCAGADIDEFAAGKVFSPPLLSEVLAEIESSTKPFVAALDGHCLGAGLELALACHIRLASAAASLGFPEIKLGLLPGAGTQRLARAIGVDAALDMILSGNPVSAERAQALGLATLAAEVQGPLVQQARSRARDAAQAAERPRVRDRQAVLPDGMTAQDYFARRIAAVRSALPAPLKCIEAVRAAVELPFDEGVVRELALFRELMDSPESRALRYAFFSERAAAQLSDVPAQAKPRTVQQVAVIGAGTMGVGIAVSCLDAGLNVTLVDVNAAALDKGRDTLGRLYEDGVKKGRLSPETMQSRLARLQVSTALADLADADLLIEAVYESIEVKEKVFGQLDTVAKPDAILASNTSTLDLNRIASFTSRPEAVVGLHFFSPANVMRLLEVVRGRQTAPDVLATAMAFARRIRKVGVVAGVCDGFIGNRMLEEYLRQAYLLLEMGALPAQVDAALKRFGMAMGPFAVLDLAGGDIGMAIRTRRAVEQPDRPYSMLPDRLVQMGRLGQKTQAGFYRYEPGQRSALPDPVVDELVIAYSKEIGIERRDINDEEIVSRCVLALVNEGARILEEGVAARASDIDVVYLNGYGFPAHRGGPMYYADQLGLRNVLSTMASYRGGYMGQFWEAAPYLQRLSEAGSALMG